MEKTKKFILHACGYTVLMALILYTILAIIGVKDQGMPIAKFLIVLGYGLLAEGAAVLYDSLPLKKPIRLLIHYAIMLTGFIVMYLTSGAAEKGVTGAKIFIATIIFTVLYAITVAILQAFKQIAGNSTSASAAKAHGSTKKASGGSKEYKPRFGGDSK